MKRLAYGLAGLLAILSLVYTSLSPVSAGTAIPLSGFKLSASTVTAGKNLTGTVSIGVAAPTGGLVVDLSSDSATAKVPASVTIGVGKKSATFTIKTLGTATVENIEITADADGSEKSVNLKVNPAVLSKLTVTKSVVGGNSLNGTVTLNGFAPASGLVVELSSSDSDVAKVPASVKVASGKSSATFSVKSVAVESTTSADITAEAGTVEKTVTVTIAQAELASIVLSRTEVTGGSTSALTATITLTGVAPTGGLDVALESSDEDAIEVQSSVTIPAGKKTLKINVQHFGVTAASTVTVSGELNGKTKSDSIEVVKAAVKSVTFSPKTAVGGETITGKVTLDAPAPDGGLKVTLKSASSKAVVDAFVIVPEGETSATFDIVTKAVTAQTNVKITAGAKFAILTIKKA